MDNKAQLTLNSMNSISSGTLLYRERGDPVDSISLLVKGRVEAVAYRGVCTVLASGNFPLAYL